MNHKNNHDIIVTDKACIDIYRSHEEIGKYTKKSELSIRSCIFFISLWEGHMQENAGEY